MPILPTKMHNIDVEYLILNSRHLFILRVMFCLFDVVVFLFCSVFSRTGAEQAQIGAFLITVEHDVYIYVLICC